jgi:hypothetical protein
LPSFVKFRVDGSPDVTLEVARVRDHGLEGGGVAVDAAEDGDAPVFGYTVVR